MCRAKQLIEEHHSDINFYSELLMPPKQSKAPLYSSSSSSSGKSGDERGGNESVRSARRRRNQPKPKTKPWNRKMILQLDRAVKVSILLTIKTFISTACIYVAMDNQRHNF